LWIDLFRIQWYMYVLEKAADNAEFSIRQFDEKIRFFIKYNNLYGLKNEDTNHPGVSRNPLV